MLKKLLEAEDVQIGVMLRLVVLVNRVFVGLAREGLSQSLRSNGELVLGSPVYITSYPKSYRENERKWAKALTKYMTDPLGFARFHSILFRPIPSRCCDSGIPGRGQF